MSWIARGLCASADRVIKQLQIAAAHLVAFWRILLQKDFWSWNEEQFSRIKTELGILIHRTGYSDSIIAQFPRSGGLMGTFATVSVNNGLFSASDARLLYPQ